MPNPSSRAIVLPASASHCSSGRSDRIPFWSSGAGRERDDRCRVYVSEHDYQEPLGRRRSILIRSSDRGIIVRGGIGPCSQAGTSATATTLINIVKRDEKNLSLHFLGGWDVLAGSTSLSLNSRKQQALLAYLATERGHHFSRQELLGYLWPEMAEDEARNNLRVTLARLRRALAAITDHSPIAGNRSDVWWQPAADERQDVAEFQRLIAHTETHAHPERAACPTCRRSLIAAVDLYRGEFLRGFYVERCPEFEEWQFVLRERLHLQALEALEDLAGGLAAAGKYDTATAFTRRQLELDPLYDLAHRRLLRLLAYQGQRANALEYYADLVALLDEELGVEPDAELVALVRQIEKGVLDRPSAAAGRGRAADTTKLPASLTPFVGREAELAALAALAARLADPAYRLLSLVGPGGMGKSRLALEVARANQQQFNDGACFVSLAPLQHPDQVPAAFAAALNLSLDSARPAAQQVVDHLSPLTMLVVVDNLEHVMDAVDFLLQILAECPDVVLVVTSRERLNVQAEDIYRLRGLPVAPADDLAHAGQYAAVHLFCDRAHRLQKSFRLSADNAQAIVEICQAVDGLPLAIELIASWVREKPIATMATAIHTNLDALYTTMRDVPQAHRSMRAVFDTSWALLSPEERLLLARLSIFRGGFSVDAAARITGATHSNLTHLRFKSLLRYRPDHQYDMHELVCQFADEKLHELEPTVDELMAVYSGYFAGLLEREAEAFGGPEPGAAVDTISRDLENVRRAWLWSADHGQLPLLARSAVGLSRYFLVAGPNDEGADLVTRGLEAVAGDALQTGTPLHLDLLLGQSALLTQRGLLAEAINQSQAIIQLAKARGDVHRQARGYLHWGYSLELAGQPSQARRQLETGLELARQAGDSVLEGRLLRYLGGALIDLNEYEQGRAVLLEALALLRAANNRAEEQPVLLYLGIDHIERREYEEGRDYLELALQLAPSTANQAQEARIRNALGFVNAALGDLEAALPYHRQSRELGYTIRAPLIESHALHNLCTVQRKLGRFADAERDGMEALRLAEAYRLDDPTAYAWHHLGYLYADMGKLPEAGGTFDTAGETWAELERDDLAIEATAGRARVAFLQGQTSDALDDVELVISFMEENSLAGIDEPLEVYLTVVTILAELADDRAETWLRLAHDQVMAGGNRIQDEAARRLFFNNIPACRQLLALWQAGIGLEPGLARGPGDSP